MTPEPSAVAPLSRWHGDGLLRRSIRFTFLLMAPLFAALLFGEGLWIAYALLACILGFLLDTGESARHELGAIAVVAPPCWPAGAWHLGEQQRSARIALALAFTGMLYALVESAHPSAAFAARFMCLTTAVGAVYVPLRMEDVAAVALSVAYAWLVSIGWDAATGNMASLDGAWVGRVVGTPARYRTRTLGIRHRGRGHSLGVRLLPVGRWGLTTPIGPCLRLLS